MALDAAKNTLHGWYKSTVEYVTPINEKSEFKEKGVLTPEEFLQAGCQLVYKCPTWQWESGDPKKRRPYLPDNQQYLISRNLPCLKRVASLMVSAANKEEIVENGEWLNMEDDNGGGADLNAVTTEIADIDLDAIDTLKSNDNDNENGDNEPATKPLIEIKEDYTPNITTTATTADQEAEAEEFEMVPDLEDFDDADNVVSTECAQPAEPEEEEKGQNDHFVVSEEERTSIVKCRTYDVSISYDKYYRVPRVWLRGYDENGNPLSSTEIFEDISADHAHKTVTVEPHVHSGVVCASIHPCRHSEVMKRFMAKFEESGKRITVDGYLFLFLKFMNAVIPTIQYDFTQSIASK